MPLQPSVQIHADIANAIMTGFVPYRGSNLPLIEAVFAFAAGVAAAYAATRLRPMASLMLGAATVLAIIAFCRCDLCLHRLALRRGRTSLALVAVLVVTSALQFRAYGGAQGDRPAEILAISAAIRGGALHSEPDRGRMAGEEAPRDGALHRYRGFLDTFAKACSARTRGPARRLISPR